jgi:hypothetical protein
MAIASLDVLVAYDNAMTVASTADPLSQVSPSAGSGTGKAVRFRPHDNLSELRNSTTIG